MEAIIAIGMPTPILPDAILRALLDHTLRRPQMLFPSLLRAHALAASAMVKRVLTERPVLAAPLLSYCLSDIDEQFGDSAIELTGLPLLPLADGNVGAFEKPGMAQLLIANHMDTELLAAMRGELVHCEALGRELTDRYTEIACDF